MIFLLRRTAVAEAHDLGSVTMAQSLWFGEFAVVMLAWVVTSFMLRRTLTDDESKPRKVAMYNGDKGRRGV